MESFGGIGGQVPNDGMNHLEIEKRLNEAIDALNAEGIIKESSEKLFNRL